MILLTAISMANNVGDGNSIVTANQVHLNLSTCLRVGGGIGTEESFGEGLSVRFTAQEFLYNRQHLAERPQFLNSYLDGDQLIATSSWFQDSVTIAFAYFKEDVIDHIQR
jgi:hypothetical protein